MPTTTSSDISVVYEPPPGGIALIDNWPSFEALAARAAADHGWWLLVERVGPDQVGVGPVFGPPSPCFRCYLARRLANGGQECRPAPARSPAVQAAVARALGGQLQPGRQLVLRADGSLTSSHLLLPRPGCGCSGGPSPGDGIAAAVSERLGIVSRLEQWTSELTGYSICVAVAADPLPTLGQVARCDGFAADRDPAAARERAIGEVLERYAAAFVPMMEPSDAQARTPGPPGWRLIRQVPAQDLQGRPAPPLPASLVHLPYLDVMPGTIQTSTGLAAGSDFAAALRHGAAECAERHAFMTAWQSGSGFQLAPVLPEDPPGVGVSEVRTDLPVLVAVAGFESDEPPYAATGLGAGWSWPQARERAVAEACAAVELVSRAGPPSDEPWPPRTLTQHALAHAWRAELSHRRGILWRPAGASPAWGGRATWQDYVRARPGDRAADVTTRDVAALGVSVVRVHAPGLLDLPSDGRVEMARGQEPHPIG